MLFNVISLQLKVRKHLDLGNADKAAFYFVIRAQKNGKPEPESAESDELSELKKLGYRFFDQDGVIWCLKPDGEYINGKDAEKQWDDACAAA
jgi:hypothetical protein